jgi:hypothetical protein
LKSGSRENPRRPRPTRAIKGQRSEQERSQNRSRGSLRACKLQPDLWRSSELRHDVGRLVIGPYVVDRSFIPKMGNGSVGRVLKEPLRPIKGLIGRDVHPTLPESQPIDWALALDSGAMGMPFLSTCLRLDALILAIAAPISSAPKLEGSSNWSPSRGWTTGSRASGEAAHGPGLSWWFRLFHRPALPVVEGSAQQSGPVALMSRRPRSQSSARIRISRPAQRTTAESPRHVRPSLPLGDVSRIP